MKKHRVKVRYVFEGHYDIIADNRQEACKVADGECGFVMGGSIHTSNDEQVKDWDFGMHPEMKILSVKQLKS